VPLKAPTIDGLVSLSIIVGAVLFYSKMQWVVLYGTQKPDLWLVLDGVEDLVDGKPQWGEVLHRLIGSERVW